MESDNGVAGWIREPILEGILREEDMDSHLVLAFAAVHLNHKATVSAQLVLWVISQLKSPRKSLNSRWRGSLSLLSAICTLL